MKLKLSEPGVAVSLLAHVSLLALLILNIPWLSDKPMDDQMPEAVPIETISQNDFNQIMKGEKTSKDVTKEPVTKADKIAQADEQHPEPAKPDAKQVTPPSPPPKPAAATPPVPTPPVPPQAPPPPPPPLPPVPEPPQRPDPTPPPPLPPEAPTPPVPTPPVPTPPVPTPTPVPPQRDPDAEVIKQATPPKPVPKPPELPKHSEVKPPPLPPKPVPTPPQPPKVVEQKPPPKPPRPVDKPDQMAKLLDQTADDAQPDAKPTPKPVKKAVTHAKAAPPRDTPAADGTAEPTDQKAFDPTDISRILNSQPAGAPPSTGKQISKVASRGATSGTAAKMSPTQSDALDGLLADQFKQCWSYLGLDHGHYIPEIKVSYGEDGSLQNEPQLLNRPSDPGSRSLAESALRAVRQCNPLHIPAQFAPFYDQWRSRILRFDPAEMAG